jgi:hypothetical protein
MWLACVKAAMVVEKVVIVMRVRRRVLALGTELPHVHYREPDH